MRVSKRSDVPVVYFWAFQIACVTWDFFSCHLVEWLCGESSPFFLLPSGPSQFQQQNHHQQCTEIPPKKHTPASPQSNLLFWETRWLVCTTQALPVYLVHFEFDPEMPELLNLPLCDSCGLQAALVPWTGRERKQGQGHMHSAIYIYMFKKTYTKIYILKIYICI